nr:laccase 3 precursor [Cerrena unicolor]
MLTPTSIVRAFIVQMDRLYLLLSLALGTNWADGPAFVNQCSIIPDNSFLYDFNVLDQAGTFWYHSHLSTQYCDGLRGAFVVYDPEDPYKDLYDVDDDSTVITLADWYRVLAPTVKFTATPNSTLINGLGRSHDGPADAELAVIEVEQGKRYRFRLVNIGCFPNYDSSINGHNMTIIEVEGVNPHCFPIQIFVAQRYSFVLNANQPVDNYWVKAVPNLGDKSPDRGINSAILRYKGAPVAEPKTRNVKSRMPLFETDLHPLERMPVPGRPVPGGADIVHLLVLSFVRTPQQPHSFTCLTMPTEYSVNTTQDPLPTGNVIGLELGMVVEVMIPHRTHEGPHPFHLHGEYNFDDPILRDVVSIGGGNDEVTIRFVVLIFVSHSVRKLITVMLTDNAGPWFLHCHIDWHLEAGLAVVFAEGIESTTAANPTPRA